MKRIFIFIVILLIPLSFMLTNSKAETSYSNETNESSSELRINYIYVDIKGAVKNPGVYKVSENFRVFHVVELAGGVLDNSDTKSVNLAAKLTDELIIYIPYYNESSLTSDTNNTLVNINTASLEELMTLTGIGEVIANNIIKYRTEVSIFKNIEDLKNCSGIGDAIFEKIKNFITV